MDYYVFITNSCNLRCNYCVFSSSSIKPTGDRQLNKGNAIEAPDVRKTADFILNNLKAMGHPKNKIVFYGGEPLMNPKWIAEFMDLTEGQIRYAIQTNGTLLDNVDRKIIERLDFLELSIDGLPKINDMLRGKDTFDRIAKNLANIQPFFKGRLVARMTYTPDNPLYESVKYLLETFEFDDVYWMLEDFVTPISEWISSTNVYNIEIQRLIEFWMAEIKKDNVLGIDPFKSIVYSLLSEETNYMFRCGFGTFLMAIDVDGACYNCDLMPTRDKRNSIGNIDKGILFHSLPKNPIYEKNCRNCSELRYCGGRCFHLSYYQDERFGPFCDRTKFLISALRQKIPEIKTLIKHGKVSKKDFEIGETLTEEIP